MSIADKVIESAFESDEAFQHTLLKVIKEDLGLTAIEFSEHSSIPPSTLYKLMSGNREPNLRTMRQIVKTIKKLEGHEGGEFIAVIASGRYWIILKRQKGKFTETCAPYENMRLPPWKKRSLRLCGQKGKGQGHLYAHLL